jgi:hypothetical protein
MRYISIALIVLLSGCSALASKTQQMSVTAYPDDATITINGQRFGEGHAVTEVKRDVSVTVSASRKGCETSHRFVGYGINGLGILDGIGGLIFLVPAVGLATSGAYSIDEDNIHLTLNCEDE